MNDNTFSCRLDNNVHVPYTPSIRGSLYKIICDAGEIRGEVDGVDCIDELLDVLRSRSAQILRHVSPPRALAKWSSTEPGSSSRASLALIWVQVAPRDLAKWSSTAPAGNKITLSFCGSWSHGKITLSINFFLLARFDTQKFAVCYIIPCWHFGAIIVHVYQL